MFEFFFKYPSAVFLKGKFVLLGSWPKWALAVAAVATIIGLGAWIFARFPQLWRQGNKGRLAAVWGLQSATALLLLTLLWRPAIMIAQLKPQQNIIAVLVDDSRSMGIKDMDGTRHAVAVRALKNGVLSSLEKNFSVRLYALDKQLSRVGSLDDLKPEAPATHIGAGLKELLAQTADLPLGAVVLLSDGDDNAGSVDPQAIAALRNRHIPVHTVGFGQEESPPDVELDNIEVAPRALQDSRVAAKFSFHQHGFPGAKSRLTIRDGDRILAVRDIAFASQDQQTETLLFNAGSAGTRTFQFSIDPVPGETNTRNNSLARLVNVETGKRRILYIEGEPRWEFKFLRRAEEDDKLVQVVSMLRTTENKVYRQGIDDPHELERGFPTTVNELFGVQAIILGSVEASYFTPAQQELIKQFVDRRGGGLLVVGGRYALADGGWAASPIADTLPVVLPKAKSTFHRDPAQAELAPAGVDNIVCRLAEDTEKNGARWKSLPSLMNYQDPGQPKPGAVVLLNMQTPSGKLPLLLTQNYGRGRTAVLATEGTWRWRMGLPSEDNTHQIFWQQLLRWLVSETPGRVEASVASPTLEDDGQTQITAEVRDENYLPAADAQVQARIIGPNGAATMADMVANPDAPGLFHTEWNAAAPGPYRVQITADRGPADPETDTVAFQRIDGAAENFHTTQNRELLQSLASATGARYWKPQELSKIADEIPYSEAGIAVREPRELWNMPALLFLMLGLRSSEWLLRRKWGIV